MKKQKKMKIITFIILAGCLLSCNTTNKTPLQPKSIHTPLDTIFFTDKKHEFSTKNHSSVADLFYPIAQSFIQTPYTPQTLEKGESETLVINLREFDCTTFIESSLALALSLNEQNPVFCDFEKNIEKIRYQKGSLTDYSSRLHYFTQWASDNCKKGIITDVTRNYGGTLYSKNIHFMSQNTYAYAALKNDSILVEKIKKIEEEISKIERYYIPKQHIASIENELKEGLIVAFTTNIEGLDIIHTGIITRQNDSTKLLHASSDFGKVVISNETLSKYIASNQLQTGIMLFEVQH